MYEQMRANPSQTREELGATNPERERRRQVMERLCNIGIAQKASDINLFHGRAGTGENWRVDPFFNNGSNNTNNHNINKIPALNAGSYDVAADFSQKRVERAGRGRAEVHQILARNPNSYILDANAIRRNGYSKLQRNEISSLIATTLPSMTDACVFNFHDGRSLNQAAIDHLDNRYYKESEAPQIARMLNISEDGAKRVIRAYNSKWSLMNDPCNTVLRFVTEDNGTQKDYPIDRDYVARWARDMGIIGTTYSVNSATLHRTIPTYQFFDLEKVGTKEQLETERISRFRKFGASACHIADMLSRDKHKRNLEMTSNSSFMDLLERDQFASPREIVQKAKEATPRAKWLFEQGTGVWEGFTLEQHTETALDIFERSSSDKLPASLHTLGRLAIVTHDLGKPMAVANGDKRNQDYYNASEAANFLFSQGCSDQLIDAVVQVIRDGMPSVSDYTLSGRDPRRRDRAIRACTDIASTINGNNRPSDQEINSVFYLCSELVKADGGAYSKYGHTRNGRIKHENSGGSRGQFNDSFRATPFGHIEWK